MTRKQFIEAYIFTTIIIVAFLLLFLGFNGLMIASERIRVGFYHMFGTNGFIADKQFLIDRLPYIYCCIGISPIVSILFTPFTYLSIM